MNLHLINRILRLFGLLLVFHFTDEIPGYDYERVPYKITIGKIKNYIHNVPKILV